VRYGALVSFLTTGIVFLIMPRESRAQGTSEMSGLHLGPGVIVDPSKGYVYVMNPGGGIDKLQIKDGQRVWNSNADGAAKPLAVAGDRLIAQATTPGAANSLKIVALDKDGSVAKDPASGKSVVGVRSLPPGVRPSIIDTPRGRFVAKVRPAGQFAVVSWEYSERPRRRGLPPGVEQKLQPTPTEGFAASPPSTGGPGHTSHAFRMNLTDGSISDEPAVAPPVGPGPAAAPPQAAPPAELLPGINAPTKIPSVDGKHVLVSTPTPPAQAPDQKFTWYTWKIYNRDAKNAADAIVKFDCHFAAADFVVNDSLVIYRTAPYKTVSPNEPAKVEVRAVDTTTGKEVWRHAVKNTSDHTPPPP
jgi:hypothetical protein